MEHIINQVYLGGQTPLPKLFTAPGFTEASAKAAIEIAERKVLALQRFIKRIVEKEVFTPVVEQAGLDSRKAGCRLNWGIPERPKIVVSDLLRAAELGLISAEEFRGVMKNLGWKLEEPETLEQ